MWYYNIRGEKIDLDTAEDLSFLSYMPKIIQKENEINNKKGYYLKPLHMFISNVDYYPVAVCLKDDLLIWA
jgi:hypothetical protein